MSAEYMRKLFLRYWWFLLLCVALCEVGVLATARLLPAPPARYQATARLSFVANTLLTERALTTVVQNATSHAVLSQVLPRYPDLTEDNLRREISATPEGNTLFLDITVTDQDSQRAGKLANDIAAALSVEVQQESAQLYAAIKRQTQDDLAAVDSQIATTSANLDNLQRQGGSASQITVLAAQLTDLQQRKTTLQASLIQIELEETHNGLTLFVVEQAQPGTSVASTSRTGTLTKYGAGLLLGLVLGGLLLLLRDRLDQRLRTSEAIGEALQSPELGKLGAAASSQAQLATNLAFLGIDKPLRGIVVTGVEAGDGASEAATDLARALVLSGKTVLLVEADLRQPTLATRAGIKPHPGFTDVAVAGLTAMSSQDLRRYVSIAPQPELSQLYLLPAGSPPPNLNQFLRSSTLAALCRALAASPVDLVVFAAPPLLEHPDARLLADAVDGVVVLVNEARARRDKLAQVHQQLEAAKVRTLGYVTFLPGYTAAERIPSLAKPG